MNVVHALGVDGARQAKGIAVVIDVLRAFTLSAYAIAGGARMCLLVPTVDEARALAAATPGAILSAEVDALPVQGIDISNSPTQIAAADVRGQVVVQRTSAGAPVINAVERADGIYASSFVVARATAQACLLRKPATVTLIASGDFPEDHACVTYIDALLNGAPTKELDELLQPLYASQRYRTIKQGDWPGFPRTDLDMALQADRFDFAMRATREENHVRLMREPA